jgi:hypothetical protein
VEAAAVADSVGVEAVEAAVVAEAVAGVVVAEAAVVVADVKVGTAGERSPHHHWQRSSKNPP